MLIAPMTTSSICFVHQGALGGFQDMQHGLASFHPAHVPGYWSDRLNPSCTPAGALWCPTPPVPVYLHHSCWFTLNLFPVPQGFLHTLTLFLLCEPSAHIPHKLLGSASSTTAPTAGIPLEDIPSTSQEPHSLFQTSVGLSGKMDVT